MTWPADALALAEAVTLDGLLSVHEHLCRARGCSAAFVPPPPDQVEELLEDLCAFANHNSLSAVAQAAITHAQYDWGS